MTNWIMSFVPVGYTKGLEVFIIHDDVLLELAYMDASGNLNDPDGLIRASDQRIHNSPKQARCIEGFKDLP